MLFSAVKLIALNWSQITLNIKQTLKCQTIELQDSNKL